MSHSNRGHFGTQVVSLYIFLVLQGFQDLFAQ
jgi:hypothetical protein